MRLRLVCVLALFMVPAMAAPASAQWFATPYLGANIGNEDDGLEKTSANFGVSAGFLGERALGLEVDLGRAQDLFLDTPVTSLMVNGIVGVPSGRTRPYVAGGLGLMHASAFEVSGVELLPSQSDLGINVGGGVMTELSDRVGLRGDLRYFRALVDETSAAGGILEDYQYWRATVGVTLKLGSK
jgi:opacity protein-like surface antigen